MNVAFAGREAAEWDLADVIVCGSEFVRDGIASLEEGPAGRCAVVPYSVDGSPVATKANRTTQLRAMKKSGNCGRHSVRSH
jgi:hypothetical protein